MYIYRSYELSSLKRMHVCPIDPNFFLLSFYKETLRRLIGHKERFYGCPLKIGSLYVTGDLQQSQIQS